MYVSTAASSSVMRNRGNSRSKAVLKPSLGKKAHHQLLVPFCMLVSKSLSQSVLWGPASESAGMGCLKMQSPKSHLQAL